MTDGEREILAELEADARGCWTAEERAEYEEWLDLHAATPADRDECTIGDYHSSRQWEREARAAAEQPVHPATTDDDAIPF